jgi:hypothetical protein
MNVLSLNILHVEMLRCLDSWTAGSVSKILTAVIFRVKHLQSHASDPEDQTMKSLRSSATICQSRHRNISEDLNLQQRRSEQLKYRLVPQGLRMPYCGWNSATQRSIPSGNTPPPFPVNSPFMILENDLAACYNLQKKKKLWVVEETVKGEWAKPWDYCMQSKVECALPRGRIFRHCEKQRKGAQADRNKENE